MKHGLFLPGLFLVACALLGLSHPGDAMPQGGADPAPVPNTECGSGPVAFTANGDAVSGSSADGWGGAIGDALGKLSGVICDFCDDGPQCEREVKTLPGFSISGLVRSKAVVDGVLIYSVSFTGTGPYTVECKSC